MKKLSIKKLVIIFVVGSVLLGGARVLTMGTSIGGFDRDSRMEQMMEDGNYSEEDMESYERGIFNKGSKRR